MHLLYDGAKIFIQIVKPALKQKAQAYIKSLHWTLLSHLTGVSYKEKRVAINNKSFVRLYFSDYLYFK